MEQLKNKGGNILSLITALLLIFAFVFAITNSSSLLGSPEPIDFTKWDDVNKDTSAIEHTAALTFTQYVIPFEVLSLVLLAALVAGLYLAKKEVE
jgi:NADH:ubiquinone oxidoreductase subunit 6 (subunit J)